MLANMDEINEFKEFLGPAANGCTSGQLRQLQRDFLENPTPMSTEPLPKNFLLPPRLLPRPRRWSPLRLPAGCGAGIHPCFMPTIFCCHPPPFALPTGLPLRIIESTNFVPCTETQGRQRHWTTSAREWRWSPEESSTAETASALRRLF